jgi:hypothetical protein
MDNTSISFSGNTVLEANHPTVIFSFLFLFHWNSAITFKKKLLCICIAILLEGSFYLCALVFISCPSNMSYVSPWLKWRYWCSLKHVLWRRHWATCFIHSSVQNIFNNCQGKDISLSPGNTRMCYVKYIQFMTSQN